MEEGEEAVDLLNGMHKQQLQRRPLQQQQQSLRNSVKLLLGLVSQ
jgi:hypothetical protein